jgi:hypothetical protein
MGGKDIDKFRRDTSTRLKKRAPWSDTPEGERVWYGLHKVYEDYMTRGRYSNSMARKYPEELEERLERRFAVGESQEEGVMKFLKEEMGGASIVSLVGKSIVEMNDGFVDLTWDFDEVSFYVLLGAPRWWNPKPHVDSGSILGGDWEVVG